MRKRARLRASHRLAPLRLPPCGRRRPGGGGVRHALPGYRTQPQGMLVVHPQTVDAVRSVTEDERVPSDVVLHNEMVDTQRLLKRRASLGTPETVCVALPRLGSGLLQPYSGCATAPSLHLLKGLRRQARARGVS